MGLTSSIAKNTLWQIAGKAIGTALGVATIGLLTRYLGQEGFGYYTTALAFMQFFGVLVDMGLYLVCLKEISAKPEKENYILANFFTLRIVSAIVLLGGGALLIFAFPYPDAVKWSAAIVSLSFFFMSLVQILTAPFQKYLRMGLVALAEVLGRVAFLGIILLFIFYKGNLPALMLGNIANTFVYFIVLWIIAGRFLKISLSFDFAYWKHIFHQAWPIALGIAFNLVYFRADTIILSLYHPAADVGVYGAPYKILEIIATFPHMFMGLVMPILTAAWLSRDSERLKAATQKTFDFFSLLVVPMIIGSLPLADRIMRVLAGKEFLESGPLLPILMLATGFIFMGTLFTYTMVVLDKQKPMLKYYFIGAVLSLVAYFIFIPKFSYFGAAWVTVAVEAFIALSAAIASYQTTKIKLSIRTLLKSIFAGLAMLSFILIVSNWSLWVLIPGAIIIYCLAVLATKAIDKQLLADIFNKGKL